MGNVEICKMVFLHQGARKYATAGVAVTVLVNWSSRGGAQTQQLPVGNRVAEFAGILRLELDIEWKPHIKLNIWSIFSNTGL